MKIKSLNFVLIILIFLPHSSILSQYINSPYPIIFVHGLNDNDQTWKTTINILEQAYSGSAQVFNAVLNAYPGYNSYKDDVLFPPMDKDGNPVNQLQNGNLYVINFNNFWNQDPKDPRIIIHDNSRPGDFVFANIEESKSNESAIYKQGYALSKCIKAVLAAVPGAKKVILVGHSMGGLAIREYLQRKDDSGANIWWQDPTDITNGHCVAKVITIGTPHYGSDLWTNLLPLFVDINPYSEAIRDLSATINSKPAIYLFGGNEMSLQYPVLFPVDVNCDGLTNSQISGLNDFTNNPLPSNISYTWIVSNWSLSPFAGDGVVNVNSQYITNDTLMTNKPHSSVMTLGISGGETQDYQSIIRGLNSPNSSSLAYEIGKNSNIAGFITYQKNNDPLDINMYKLILSKRGYLKMNIGANSSSGFREIALLDNTGTGIPLIYKYDTFLGYLTQPGTYYIRVEGLATNTSYEYPFTLTTTYAELQLNSLNSNQNFQIGSTMNIGWSSSNISNINIDYTTNGGTNWNPIVASTQASVGSYNWTIPNSPSTNCKIRISDAGNSANYDTSNVAFTIVSSVSYNSLVLDNLDGTTLGNAVGITYTNTPNNKGAVFNRTNDSRIEYSFDSQIPRQGTLELLINVQSGYYYSNYTLYDNQKSAQIWGTDCHGGDVYWPGAMIINVSDNGSLTLFTETAYGQPQATSLTASNTVFKFNEWHSIGISYGNQGQYICLDGKIVASNTNYTLPLSAAGNFNQPTDKPTIGKVVSSFWEYNQYDGGFNGVVNRFRTSSNQKDWFLTVTDIKNVCSLPTSYSLMQNYPNPFNPTTTINYSVLKSGLVTIKVYDILGREVATLVNENKPVGNYGVEFNANKLTSGIYFYRMESGSFSQTKKLSLLK